MGGSQSMEGAKHQDTQRIETTVSNKAQTLVRTVKNVFTDKVSKGELPHVHPSVPIQNFVEGQTSQRSSFTQTQATGHTLNGGRMLHATVMDEEQARAKAAAQPTAIVRRPVRMQRRAARFTIEPTTPVYRQRVPEGHAPSQTQEQLGLKEHQDACNSMAKPGANIQEQSPSVQQANPIGDANAATPQPGQIQTQHSTVQDTHLEALPRQGMNRSEMQTKPEEHSKAMQLGSYPTNALNLQGVDKTNYGQRYGHQRNNSASTSSSAAHDMHSQGQYHRASQTRQSGQDAYSNSQAGPRLPCDEHRSYYGHQPNNMPSYMHNNSYGYQTQHVPYNGQYMNGQCYEYDPRYTEVYYQGFFEEERQYHNERAEHHHNHYYTEYHPDPHGPETVAEQLSQWSIQDPSYKTSGSKSTQSLSIDNSKAKDFSQSHAPVKPHSGDSNARTLGGEAKTGNEIQLKADLQSDIGGSPQQIRQTEHGKTAKKDNFLSHLTVDHIKEAWAGRTFPAAESLKSFNDITVEDIKRAFSVMGAKCEHVLRLQKKTAEKWDGMEKMIRDNSIQMSAHHKKFHEQINMKIVDFQTISNKLLKVAKEFTYHAALKKDQPKFDVQLMVKIEKELKLVISDTVEILIPHMNQLQDYLCLEKKLKDCVKKQESLRGHNTGNIQGDKSDSDASTNTQGQANDNLPGKNPATTTKEVVTSTDKREDKLPNVLPSEGMDKCTTVTTVKTLPVKLLKDITLADIKRAFKFIGSGLENLEADLNTSELNFKASDGLLQKFSLRCLEDQDNVRRQLTNNVCLAWREYRKLLCLAKELTLNSRSEETQVNIDQLKRSVEKQLKEASEQARIRQANIKQYGTVIVEAIRALRQQEKSNEEKPEDGQVEADTQTEQQPQNDMPSQKEPADGDTVVSSPGKSDNRKARPRTKVISDSGDQADYKCPFTVASHYDDYYIKGQKATNKEPSSPDKAAHKKPKRYHLSSPPDRQEVTEPSTSKRKRKRQAKKQSKVKWANCNGKESGKQAPDTSCGEMQVSKQCNADVDTKCGGSEGKDTKPTVTVPAVPPSSPQKQGNKGLGGMVDDRHLFCEAQILLPKKKSDF